MKAIQWTPWKPLDSEVLFTIDSLAETLFEGQAFRWTAIGTGEWQGQWSKFCVRVKSTSSTPKPLQVAFLKDQKAEAFQAALEYFNAGQDYPTIIDALPWRSDPLLKQCMDLYPGLRILKQPFDEALLIFLCSSSKRISQIKACIERLAARFGEPIANGLHALPTWKALANASEEDLRTCGLGYRARFIHGTALTLANNPHFLDHIIDMDYSAAQQKLCELPGVGAKIADCALLYGAGFQQAFPVDTWIHKAMTDSYQLKDWNLNQIAQFGRIHFGKYAGLAQQFIFAAVRNKHLKSQS